MGSREIVAGVDRLFNEAAALLAATNGVFAVDFGGGATHGAVATAGLYFTSSVAFEREKIGSLQVGATGQSLSFCGKC